MQIPVREESPMFRHREKHAGCGGSDGCMKPNSSDHARGVASSDAKESMHLYAPFFATTPFPSTLDASHLGYFFTALQQLSQLVCEVATNALAGKDACLIKRSILFFHISHFVHVSFADPGFMKSLTPVDAKDKAAVEYISLICWLGEQFVMRWNEAIESRSPFSCEDTSAAVGKLWIAVKNTAEAITLHTILQENLTKRVYIRTSWWRTIVALFTEGNIPQWLCLASLFCGVLSAIISVVVAWVSCNKNSRWAPIVISVVTTLGLGVFLFFFYMLTLWQSRSQWLSQLLAENHLAEFITRESENKEHAMGRDVQFTIRSKDNELVNLSIASSVVNRQIVLIGIVDTKSLVICSWNQAARMATGILPVQAIERSLEAVMEVKSIVIVRRLFRELKTNPRQKQRLLLNNIKKKTHIAIEATVTIAHANGIPIGMIVGTVVEEERTVISHLSRVHTYSTLTALNLGGCLSPTIHGLVLNSGWDALKQRTAYAMRGWRSSTLDELLNPLRETLPSELDVSLGKDVPKQLYCDAASVQQLVARLAKLVFLAENDPLSLVVVCVGCGSDGCLALQIDATVPQTSVIELQCHHDILELISLVGHLTFCSRRHVQIIVPISLKPLGMTPENDDFGEHSTKNFLSYTFILHEPDVVYMSHFDSFCNRSQHRVFSVKSVASLRATLDSLLNEVTTVILSASSPEFDLMMCYCREKGVFVTVTRERGEGGTGNALSVSVDGPPHNVSDGDYLLQKPVSEERWLKFLEYLLGVREQKQRMLPPATTEWIPIRRIGEGSCSFVDLVQDKLTGGYMACKTVFVTHERSLSALQEEVNIMRQCSNPFIVKCISTSQSASTSQFRMFLQFCPDSLVSYARKKIITPKQLTLYAFQLVSAVQHLHERGIAHRDVKPANILMMNDRHLKLADFGSATTRPFDEGNVHGATPQYMAPERLLLPTEDVSWRKTPMDGLFMEDIWSIGLTLLEVIGAYPSVLKNRCGVRDFLDFYMHLRDSGEEVTFKLPVDNSGDEPEEWSKLHDFVSSMLQMQPQKRPRASELLQHPFIKDAACESEFSDRFAWPVASLWSGCASRPSNHIMDDIFKSQSSLFTAEVHDDEAEERFSEKAFNSVVN